MLHKDLHRVIFMQDFAVWEHQVLQESLALCHCSSSNSCRNKMILIVAQYPNNMQTYCKRGTYTRETFFFNKSVRYVKIIQRKCYSVLKASGTLVSLLTFCSRE